jgi:hypothetical protein
VYLRITEILANPPGTDRGKEWVELCADAPVFLDGYALMVGARTLALSGSLPAGSCSLAYTGSASIRNREPEISLLYKDTPIQSVRGAGSAPEGYGFHAGGAGYWASSTPGIPDGPGFAIPPLPPLGRESMFPGLLGTAVCTAGILTALAIAAFRHARDRHHERAGGDRSARRSRSGAPDAHAA